ncbi:hypothetical protein ACW4YW_04665 [Methylobacillus pratensis]
MIFIADNDVIYKVIHCNLIEEFLVILEVPPNEILILSSLKYVLKNKLKGCSDSLKRLDYFLSKSSVIPPADNDLLNRYSTLDIGERQLLAVFSTQENAKMITGDKRAIREISIFADNDDTLFSKLEGNVLCFEKVLYSLIEKYGFDHIDSKITKSNHTDKFMKLTFGRNAEHALESIMSNLNALSGEAKFILFK